jgi:hypothetical protein
MQILSPYEKPPGPIDSNAAAELVGVHPFTMTFGQWKFIHGEYGYHRVQSLSSGSQEGDEDTSPSSLGSSGLLQVDTGPNTSMPPLLDKSLRVSPTGKLIRTPSLEVDETESPDDQAARQYIQSLVDCQVTSGLQMVKTQLEGNLLTILQEAKIHTDLLQDQLRQSAIRNNTLIQEADHLR